MRSFKRAVSYITRNRGRGVILAVVFTILFMLLTVGLSIGNGTQETAAELRRYFKIESDVSAAGGNQTINKDLAEDVRALPGVTAYDGLDLYFLTMDDLVLLPGYFTLKGDAKAQLGITEEEAKRNALRLSRGQQQRVALAQTLASGAPVILADEPTGNLDEENAREVTRLFKENAHRLNKCVLVVSHSQAMAEQADVLF